MMSTIIHMINMIILFNLTSKKFYTYLISLSTLSQWDLQNSKSIYSSRFNLNVSIMLIIIFMQLHRKFAINKFSNTSNLLYWTKQFWQLFNNSWMSDLNLYFILYLILHLTQKFWCYYYTMLLFWKTNDIILNLLVRK